MSVLVPYALLLAFLLLCSAFFSGSESAFFSLDRYELEKLEEEGGRSATAIRGLLDQPRRLLATLLLGNELVNISISTVGLAAVFAFAEARGHTSVPWWLNIVVVTPLLLLFGELAPKAMAVRLGIAWTRVVALPLQLFGTVVAPVRWVIHGIADILLKAVGIQPEDPLPDALVEAQFKALVRLGEKQGVIDADEAELIHRVFDLNDTPVTRIMTPRKHVVAVAWGSPLDELMDKVKASRFSRVPVFVGDPDNLKGILMTKDLLRSRWRGEELDPRRLEGLVKPAYFVPPGKTCGDLLQEFQVERGHMAVVLDEHGGMLGIVTLQDILEELFVPVEEIERGSLPEVERIATGLFRVPARMEVADWNRDMAPPIPEGDSYNTVAGYIFHLFGRLPGKGEQIRDDGWVFHISGLDGTRLTWITAQRREDPR